MVAHVHDVAALTLPFDDAREPTRRRKRRLKIGTLYLSLQFEGSHRESDDQCEAFQLRQLRAEKCERRMMSMMRTAHKEHQPKSHVVYK